MPVHEIPSTSTELAQLRKKHPIILLVGGEEHGLPYYLAQHASQYATIRREKDDKLGVDSLNVSVATSLVLSEFIKAVPPEVEVGASIMETDESSTSSENRIF